ncbi:hypothetical protein ANO11243_092640 [Dothideomycetidae sp. 11243]|nr:hypothetical protein ANO11243_092640 [fungal sp. No.11243]
MLSRAMTADPQPWTDVGIDTAPILSMISALQTQTTAVVGLQAVLNSVNQTATRDIASPAEALLLKIKAMYRNNFPPDMDTATIDAVHGVTQKGAAYLHRPRRPAVRTAFLTAMANLRVPEAAPDGGPLTAAISDAQDMLKSNYEELKQSVQRRGVAHGGHPGRSGRTNVGTPAPATNASLPGGPGSVVVHNLGFDGRRQDAALESAFVLPDQVQMVLDTADSLYWSNAPKDVARARRLYLRLVERLSVVTALNGNSGFDRVLSRLASISLYSSGSLSRQRNFAKSMCSQILAGQDMWAHAADWAPRLAWNFFANMAEDRINGLTELEDGFQKYVAELDSAIAGTAFITEASPKLMAGAAEARQRKDYYGGSGGLMAAAAGRINALSPLLVAKHRKVLSLEPNLLAQINDQTNTDWGTLLEAVGGFAFGAANGAAQLANSWYKFSTQIKSGETGTWVDKEKVIDDIQDAGKDLKSVAHAWSTRADGFISVDEAKSTKLIASRDKIEAILKEFKSGLPDNVGDEFKAALDDYVDTAIARNNAVVDYNGSLQLYLQAVTDEGYFQGLQARYGESQLKVDPTLPSVVNWFKTQLNAQQLDAMRLLNYGAAAIRFWDLRGAREVSSFSFGPLLQNHIGLRQTLTKLKTAFESVLSDYAGNTRIAFPRDPNQKGKFWRIPDATLAQLKTRHEADLSADSSARHVADIVIPAPQTPEGRRDLPENRRKFADAYNVRVSQLRVWLPGATVDPSSSDGKGGDPRRPLVINIVQGGAETMVDVNGHVHHFTHDVKAYNFEYETTGVLAFGDCSQDKVLQH